MKRIVTLTLNPALDVSAIAPMIVAGPKLRCGEARLDPGGGGVNVSRAILRLGDASTALVAAGGVTGALLCDLLEVEGVAVERVDVDGLTRQSFAVTDARDAAQYRFVMPGPVWGAENLDALWAALDRYLEQDVLLIVSGSLPPGVSPDVLVDINARAVAAGAHVCLDTSGSALIAAVAATVRPFHLLRVDGAEAEELAARPLPSIQDLAEFAQGLVATGKCDRAVMALGATGTLGVSAKEAFFCATPPIATVSAVGAGDSLVGAMMLALARGEGFRAAVAFGVAAAGAAVMTPATELCDRGKTEALLDKIMIRNL